MSNQVDNPLKWLLLELPKYVPAARLSELLTRFDANKAAYERQVKANVLERRIKVARSFAASPERDAQIARWQAKLNKLKEGT